MQIKEALEYWKFRYNRTKDYNDIHWEASERREHEEYVEALKSAIIALEKQIPKKVTHEATLAKCCTCPHCKNVVDEFTTFAGAKVRVTYNYCRFCGQRLDWSEP